MVYTRLPESFAVTQLPARVTAKMTKLTAKQHRILLKKKQWLEDYSVITPPDFLENLSSNPTAAVLVFAQEEAGTAVCVSARGLFLTCSHCVAETEDELDWDQIHWLLFASGQLVAAKSICWDSKRDLALLQIVKATGEGPENGFPHVEFSQQAPSARSQLLCIGHPGSEDLQASTPGVQTNYDVLVLSEGTFKGLAKGQDPQDNSEIGALKHNCWTYWGHSGAPLLDRRSGMMVGMHSSWDDKTGMRRGVPWEALREFLLNFEKEFNKDRKDDDKLTLVKYSD